MTSGWSGSKSSDGSIRFAKKVTDNSDSSIRMLSNKSTNNSLDQSKENKNRQFKSNNQARDKGKKYLGINDS